jgi:hypothetical protein
MSDDPKEPALIDPPKEILPDSYEIKWSIAPGGATWKVTRNRATSNHDNKLAVVTRDAEDPNIWWYERDDVPKERLKIEGIWQSQLVTVMNKLRAAELDRQCWLLNTQGKPLEGWWTRLYWRLIETLVGT